LTFDSPAAVVEDSDDYADLVPAFVATDALEWCGTVRGRRRSSAVPDIGDRSPLIEGDRASLIAPGAGAGARPISVRATSSRSNSRRVYWVAVRHQGTSPKSSSRAGVTSEEVHVGK